MSASGADSGKIHKIKDSKSFLGADELSGMIVK